MEENNDLAQRMRTLIFQFHLNYFSNQIHTLAHQTNYLHLGN